MSRAINPTRPFEYITKADRELEGGDTSRTVWRLRGLTMREHQEIQDGAAVHDDGQMKLLSGSVTVATLQLGVLGVDNFLDDDGAAVEFEQEPHPVHTQRKVASRGFLGQIHPDDRTELAEAIGTFGALSKDEAGKS